MRKYIIIGLFILSILNFVPSAIAETCPAPGPDFGPHISSMAPKCPLMDGKMFGNMASSMAKGIPCPMQT